jgi:hypothetical protein
MPDFITKYLIYAAIVVGLCSASFVKGCQHGKSEGEAEKAAAIAVAAEEKARIATEHAQELSKYQEKEKDDEKARTDLADATRELRNATANYRRSAPFTVPSNPVCPANELLAECGNVYRETTLRGAERVADCGKQLIDMAGKAEEERGKVELSNSLYESIRKRQPK